MPRGKKPLDQTEILKRFREVHGMRYLYSKVVYQRMNSKVEIVCRKKGHGSFFQNPSSHINQRQGCPKCANKGSGNNYGKLSIEEIIDKGNKKHKNKYDYSLCKERNSKYMNIICPIHGKFKQNIRDHLMGNGCPKCANKGSEKNGRLSSSEILKRFKKVHGNTYDYSKTFPIDSATRVIVTCKIHGDFTIAPYRHYGLKRGCPKCVVETNGKNKRITQEEFLKRAYEIHGNTYDYSKSVYRDMHTPVIISCYIHGEFTRTPFRHIKDKCGCPACIVVSKGEAQIASIFNDNDISFIPQHTFPDLINVAKLRFDFAVFKNKKLLFLLEYHGPQHYNQVPHFGGVESLKIRKRLDKKKREYCWKKNIPLYEISYKEDLIKTITSILKRRRLLRSI